MENSFVKNAVAVLVSGALLGGCGSESPEALVNSAKTYLAANDNKAAVIQLKNALQAKADYPEARFLLAKVFYNSGDPVSAEVELQKARDLKYFPDDVVPLLARALNAQGKFRKVTDELSPAQLTTDRAKADLQTSYAIAHAAMGNLEASRTALEAALSHQPDFPQALVFRARMTAGEGDLAGARGVIDKVLAVAPGDHEASKIKGDILVAQGDEGGAQEAYRKSIEARPAYVLAHAALVDSLLRDSKAEEAAQAFAAMKKAAPKHPRTLYIESQMAFRKKDFKAARAIAQELLSVAPSNPNALQLAGTIELQLGSWLQAESYLNKALQSAPDLLVARRLLVSLYMKTGQSAKAMSSLQPLLERAEKDPDLLALAGEVYLQNGDVNKASDYFAKASALDPKDLRKRTSVALVQMLKGDVAGAFHDLELLAAEDAGTTADMALISAHMRRKEFDKALKAVDRLEKKQPESAAPHHLRGNVLAAKKDLPGARKSFERALQVDPGYFASAAALAAMDLADKKPDDAKKRFESMLAANPKNAQALLALAELKGRQDGSTDEVAALIQKAVSASPAEAGPRIALVGWLLNRKEPKRAVVAAQEAVAAIPDHPELLDVLGRAQQASGDNNQALATYAKMAGLQPSSPVPHLRAAEIKRGEKNNDAAAESLRKALAIKPDLIEAMRGLATLNLESGKVREAIDLAREVQKKHPQNPSGYLLEGDINANRKAWDDAITAYRKGVEHAPSAELAIKLHALLLAHKSREASGFEASWMKSHPRDAAFQMYLGESALRTKDYAAAARLYRSVLAIQPNNALALNNLAWVAGQQKDPKALEYAEKANALLPNQAPFMDTLAGLLSEKGDTARAIDLMKKALEIAPEAAAIRLNYARVMIRAGDKQGARRELEALTKLGDKFSGQAEVARLIGML